MKAIILYKKIEKSSIYLIMFNTIKQRRFQSFQKLEH